MGRENANGSGTISEQATGLSRGSCRKSTVLHNLRLKGLRQYNRVRNILELSSRNREKEIKNHKKKKGKVLKQAREKR